MTPRIPAFDELPPRLFEPQTGAVAFCLYPFHLERLHGEWPVELDEAEAKPSGGEFPLLPDSHPTTITLNAGMSPSEIGPQELITMNNAVGDISWWQWHAYAKTTLGWIASPLPTFTQGRLSHLILDLEAESDPEEFERIESVLTEELGPPHKRRKSGFRPGWWGRNPSIRDDRLWTFPWGEVQFGHEHHHGGLQVGIRWSGERL